MCADPWQHLYLSINQIGDAGVAALAKVIAEGAMPKLKVLALRGNPGSCEPVAKALRERGSA